MNSCALYELLDPELIKDLDAETKSDALEEMVRLLGSSPKVMDAESFRDAILSRESQTSTGIGLSVAIPHARIDSVTDYVIAIGRSKTGIEYDSVDHLPVKLVFMVGASDRQAAEFVRLLAQIVKLIKDDSTRAALLEAATPEDVCEAIRQANGSH